MSSQEVFIAKKNYNSRKIKITGVMQDQVALWQSMTMSLVNQLLTLTWHDGSCTIIQNATSSKGALLQRILSLVMMYSWYIWLVSVIDKHSFHALHYTYTSTSNGWHLTCWQKWLMGCNRRVGLIGSYHNWDELEQAQNEQYSM